MCPAGKLYGQAWLLAYSKPAGLFAAAVLALAVHAATDAHAALRQRHLALPSSLWFPALLIAGFTCCAVMVFLSTLQDMHSALV